MFKDKNRIIALVAAVASYFFVAPFASPVAIYFANKSINECGWNRPAEIAKISAIISLCVFISVIACFICAGFLMSVYKVVAQ